jgi:hypothetical protein
MTSRLRLFGRDLAALHAIVPPSSLPAEFGGTASEPRDWLMQELREKERTTGSIGGWAVPLSVEDPTGEKRRAAAAAAAAVSQAPVAKADSSDSDPAATISV